MCANGFSLEHKLYYFVRAYLYKVAAIDRIMEKRSEFVFCVQKVRFYIPKCVKFNAILFKSSFK